MLVLTPAQKASAESVFAMGIVLDSARRRVLLRIPNALGWKYHFGCAVRRQSSNNHKTAAAAARRVPDDDDDSHEVDWPTTRILSQQLVRALPGLDHKTEDDSSPMRPRHVGCMRFDFESSGNNSSASRSTTPSMLVHVHALDWTTTTTTTTSSSRSTQTSVNSGEWYDYDAVPYGDMWADDILWMPQLLRHYSCYYYAGDDDDDDQHEYYFEGHFVFDGPPGNATPLLRHEVAVRNGKEKKNPIPHQRGGDTTIE